MKKNFILPLLFAASMLFSCASSNEDQIEPENLVGKKMISVSANNDKYPCFVMNNDLLISSSVVDHSFYCSTLKENKWDKAEILFERGNGHKEFHNIGLCDGPNNSLWVLDCPMSANALYSLTSIPDTRSMSAIRNKDSWDRYDLKGISNFLCFAENPVMVSDSTFLVLGAPCNDLGHLFSLVNFKTQKVTPLNFWPNDGIKCDIIPKASLYLCNSKIYGDGKGHYLYHCSRGRYAFLFSIDGNNVNVIKTIYSDYPIYGMDNSKLNWVINASSYKPKELRSTATKEKIYVLLIDCDKNGKKYEKLPTNRFMLGNVVEIYDWEGNKERVLHLDKCGTLISVSRDNKKLYLHDGTSTMDEPIWVYDLDEHNNHSEYAGDKHKKRVGLQ